MSLSSNPNVCNTCLRILRGRGFDLRVEGNMTADDCYPTNASWIATNESFSICAGNPIELLGLVAIHDFVGGKSSEPYWWEVEGPDVWTELKEAAFPERQDDQ